MKKLPTPDELRRRARPGPNDDSDAGPDGRPDGGPDGGSVDGMPYRADSLPPDGASAPTPPAGSVSPVRLDLAAAVAAAGLAGGDGDGDGDGGTSPAGRGAAGAARHEDEPAAGGTSKGIRPASRRPAEPNRRQQRRYARERAVQALYQWHMTGSSSSQVRLEFLATQDMSRADVEYFEEAFRGVTLTPATIDDELATVLDRELAEVDPIERAILRLATWELRSRPDTPVLVVINEGVEIAKRFCAEPGYRYVNGVLDRLATLLRAAEMNRT